jgi:hypothetical protein
MIVELLTVYNPVYIFVLTVGDVIYKVGAVVWLRGFCQTPIYGNQALVGLHRHVHYLSLNLMDVIQSILVHAMGDEEPELPPGSPPTCRSRPELNLSILHYYYL